MALITPSSSIDHHWTTDSHSIKAVDNSSSQNAFLTIQVIPTGTPVKTSTELSVTMNGIPVQMLTFKAVIGQVNPPPQRITITNTSGATLKWMATASSDNNLSWLMINDDNIYGQLATSQPHNILISANIAGLHWSVNPDDNIKDNIKFLPLESGILLPSGSVLPSGQPGDTVVLTLQCNAIQVGRHYHVSVYANLMSWPEFVIVQR